MGERLTVATWNIHACIGGDGTFRPDRVAAVLAEMGADLVALQEVEQHRVAGADLLDYLADAAGLRAIPGLTLKRDERGYGNAVLTRLPVRRVSRVDLSVAGREPRGALDVLLDWHGRRLQVVATHLGLRPGERRRQIRRILTRFEIARPDCALLMGDLNEWLLWGRPLRWLRGHFLPTPDIRTYPARCPLFALDQVWAEPRSALHDLRVHKSACSRLASDHLPLLAELWL